MSGMGNRAASAATSPYRSLRPLGACTTTLGSVWHSDTGTCQRCAAAEMSMARATAPVCRSGVQFAATEREPPAP